MERRISLPAYALEALGVGYFLTYAKSDLFAHPAILHFQISPSGGCQIVTKCHSEALGVGYFFKHRS